MFLLDHGPDALSVVDALGAFAYLDAGEAVFVPAGSAGSMTPLFDGAVAAGERVTFVADGGPSSFTPGPAKRDVNVVRDVLAPGETFSTSSSFPVLVIVQEGSLTDVADPSAALGPDSATTLGTSVELRNDGDAPASVVAVVIGTVVA